MSLVEHYERAANITRAGKLPGSAQVCIDFEFRRIPEQFVEAVQREALGIATQLKSLFGQVYTNPEYSMRVDVETSNSSHQLRESTTMDLSTLEPSTSDVSVMFSIQALHRDPTVKAEDLFNFGAPDLNIENKSVYGASLYPEVDE